MPSSLLQADAPDEAAREFRAARIHEGWLLPVLLPVLALNLIGSFALDLLTGADQLMIVDGGLSVTDEAAPVSALKLGLTVATWLVALCAGAVAAVGVRRGRTTDPGRSIMVALRQLPVLALGLGVAAGVSLGVLWAVAGLAAAVDGGTVGVVLIAGTSVMLALVGARLLHGVLTRVFGGSAWRLTRGRVLRTAGVFLVGGVGLPLLAAYGLEQLRSEVRVPVLLDLLEAALLVGVVAVQATLLARSYLLPRDAVPLNAAGFDVVDLDAVDARLSGLAGRRPQWLWLGAAALVLPALLSAGIAVTDPFGAPSIRTSDSVPAVAVAWPAGQHPVIVDEGGSVRFCDNDLCDRYVGQFGMPAMDGWSTSTIGPDGTVVTVATTGSEQNGGPFIEYAKCTRAGCQHEWLPVRASAREKFAWPTVAGVAAPDGSIWFAVAMPAPEGDPGRPAYTFSMIRCAQVPCTAPQRHVVDTMKRADDSGSRYGRMTMAADGRPVASFWLGTGFHVVTCDPVTCANPRAGVVGAGSRDAAWSTPAGLADTAVSLKDGTLTVGDGDITLAAEVAAGSGALAVSGPYLYATVAEATTTARSGLHLSVGERSSSWQQVVWRCERANCHDPERLPLNVLPGEGGREVMAVGPHGRVLIVGAQRTTLFSPGSE